MLETKACSWGDDLSRTAIAILGSADVATNVELFREDFTALLANGFMATPGADQPGDAWTRIIGPTPTTSTGPNGGANASTRAVEGSNPYAYTEASAIAGPFTMETPDIDASLGTAVLTFDYHMKFGSIGGIATGTLKVQGWNGSAWSDIGPSITGSQQTSADDPYLPSTGVGTYNSSGFSNTDFKFRFHMTKGDATANFDTAVDNVVVRGPAQTITPPDPPTETARLTALLNGNRTIFVATDGDNGNSGLAENLPKRTIQAALNIVQPGDVVLIEDGTYFESCSLTNSGATVAEPIVIAARNPGQVTVSNLIPEALNGTATWINRGSGVYGLPIATQRSYIGYEVENGNFIPGYRSNTDINATSISTNLGANVQQATTNKPQYGMSFGSGEVRVKLRDGSNPTGQAIALTDGFSQVQLDLTNSSNTIVDGIVFDGAGDTFAVDMDLGSQNVVLTNCKFFSCQFGVRPGDNCLIDNCEYSQIGTTQFRIDLNDEPGNGDASTAIFRYAKNHYVGDIVGTNVFDALLEGGIIGGAFNTTPAQTVRVTHCLIKDAFEGCKLGRSQDPEYDNNRVVNIMDDGVEVESSGTPPVGPSGEALVHDNRFTNCTVATSHQEPALAVNQRVYRNVIEVTDQAISRMAYPHKTSKTPTNTNVQFYHNTYKHISANGETTEGFGDHSLLFPFAAGGVNGGLRVDVFENNCIIYEDLDFPSNQPSSGVIQNNVLANDDNASWRVNGGSFEGPESNLLLDANFVPAAGSPLANAGGTLPGGLPDSRPEQTTVGVHEVGAAIDANWPRPDGEFFRDTSPPRWTEPGAP